MAVRRRRWAWGAVFFALFVLSLDYWRWDRPPQLGPFGIPAWTHYFVWLQVLLAAAVAAFARTAWKGDPAPPPDDSA